MGLDMYLNGSEYFHGLTELEKRERPIEHVYRLGYWRKHPDLHGYIVENFADHEDNCQPVELSVHDMTAITEAIMQDMLPHTSGPSFGESANDSVLKREAIDIFLSAIKWLNSGSENTWRSVFYQATW